MKTKPTDDVDSVVDVVEVDVVEVDVVVVVVEVDVVVVVVEVDVVEVDVVVVVVVVIDDTRSWRSSIDIFDFNFISI